MDNVIISEHCVPENIFATKGYHERYSRTVDWFDDDRNPIVATNIAMESDGPMRTTVMEILTGVMRDENKNAIPAEEELSERPMTTLATVDGKPFAGTDDECHVKPGVKTSQKAFTAEKIRDTLRRGGDYIKRAKYGSRFTVDTAQAIGLLQKYGYRTADARYTRAGQKDMWLLYEVGGPLEAEVHRLYPDSQKKKR